MSIFVSMRRLSFTVLDLLDIAIVFVVVNATYPPI
jgi:hypothetical protein